MVAVLTTMKISGSWRRMGLHRIGLNLAIWGAAFCAGSARVDAEVGKAADPLAASEADNADTVSQKEMVAELRQLRARVAQLEARAATGPTREEVDATVRRVMEDAERRSRMFGDGNLSVNYANGRLTIASEDGDFLIHPWLHLQVRNATTWREGADADGGDDWQNGFEIRRAKFGIDGNLFTKDLQYFLNWASYRGNGSSGVTDASGNNVGTTTQQIGGTPVLEEAWVLWHFHDTPWSIKGGQIHDPLSHEAIIGSKYRAPEASLQADIFANTDTFTQGVTVIYDPKTSVRFEGGVTDGIRSANTSFRDYPNNGIQYDWGVAGRAEWKAFGDWREYNQLTAYGNKHDLLVLGAGVDNSERSSSDALSHTVDVQYATSRGLMLYGSYFGRYVTNNPGIALGGPVSTSIGTPADFGQDTYEYSFLGEVAYMVTKKFEPFARYEYLRLAGTPAGSQNSVHEISVGMNYYFFGHNAKLTTQLMYLPAGIPVADEGADVLPSNGKAEFIVMEQFQLVL